MLEQCPSERKKDEMEHIVRKLFTWSAVHPSNRRKVGIFKLKSKKIGVKGQVVHDISFFFLVYILVT